VSVSKNPGDRNQDRPVQEREGVKRRNSFKQENSVGRSEEGEVGAKKEKWAGAQPWEGKGHWKGEHSAPLDTRTSEGDSNQQRREGKKPGRSDPENKRKRQSALAKTANGEGECIVAQCPGVRLHLKGAVKWQEKKTRVSRNFTDPSGPGMQNLGRRSTVNGGKGSGDQVGT